jgi:hypothetical protein
VIRSEELARSPAWFPLESGAAGLRLLALDESAYREASFLDQRLLRGGYVQDSATLAEVHTAAAQLCPRAHYIFHTGHVGSTLISRLVGELPGSFFSLREPALLRAAAASPDSGTGAAPLQLGALLALLSRAWRPGQRAVIKTTSFVSELAPRMLSLSESPRAIFLYAAPPAYLASILIGPSSRAESQLLAAQRRARLLRRLSGAPGCVDPSSEGEHVALSWLTEMLALAQAAQGRAGQLLWLDFDRFLRAPHEWLTAVLRALGADPSPREVAALVDAPLMRQYSKAPKHAYDAQLRWELLESAQHEHGAEIRRGLEWLARLAREYPPVRDLLEAVAAMSAAGPPR